MIWLIFCVIVRFKAECATSGVHVKHMTQYNARDPSDALTTMNNMLLSLIAQTVQCYIEEGFRIWGKMDVATLMIMLSKCGFGKALGHW